MAAYELIVPPIAIQESTGFLGGAKKKHRGAVWLCELYRAGWRITKDDVPVRKWDDVPEPVKTAARDARRILEEAESMKGTQ